ncbi:MAG: hypothetical protein CMN58_08380 [Solibacterales bacterium]|nr:hypothetical protein [Bryobacterales bacterium]|tara:strand:- start:987 stop:1808 length:822 start_codon:yes stop_codon:yes gene_type:complete
MQKTLSTIAPIILLAVTLSGCAPAPLGRNYWNQAHRQFEQGDYADTLAYLNDILSRDTDYDNRASGWKVVILGAMTRAAVEWEEACGEGVYFVPQWESKSYRICIEQYRRQTKTRLLALLDAIKEFEQVTQDFKIVKLAFPLPAASVVASPILRRIKVGNMPPSDDILDAAAARTLDRHFILQSLDVVGVKDSDVLRSRFTSLPVQTTKTQFLLGVARTLEQASSVFEAGRLNDNVRRKLVLKRARECLRLALEDDNEAVKNAARALARKTRG